MQIRKLVLGLLCICWYAFVSAQNAEKKPANKLRFHSINQLGCSKGASESAFLFQSVNGFTYRTWFAGAGVGIDDYRYNSVPVFLDVRKYVKNKENSFFVYADAGASLPFKKKTENEFGFIKEFKTGLYYDAGLGYKIQLQKTAALLMSIGYTQKNTVLNEKGASFIFDDEPSFITRHDYQFKRLVFKIGFAF